jgi:GcrA cell cycle regulator
MSNSVWSDTTIAELRTLWNDGLSASGIADAMNRKFGFWFSRSSICGKVRRLRLPGRKKAASRTPQAPKPARPIAARKVRRILNHTQSTMEAVEKLPAELPAADIPIEQRKTLIELGNETCRWPYGDPSNADFFFCGAPEADFAVRIPYCRFHTAFACGRIKAPAIVPGSAAA